ncbi:syntaxin [Pholiota conissans]|uniref:Syntaxin n=1 Tax=Pholiota conissans TaxID=109636 RepID=A0A9P6CW21_9AGAR|nr:syntaxin [Pholiota conissans]
MTAIQAVFIRGFEERTSPKTHVVYRIDIQAHVRSWLMWRRYSEFDDLHTEITKATGSSPPTSLPPKHPFSLLRSKTNAKLLEERRQGLEAYLRAIVSAKDEKWRETYAFKEFLGVPVGRQGGVEGGVPSQFTSSTWLDEHAELQARLRDVWADINKRDALSDRGDVPGAHKSNVSAKAKLAGVLSRIGTLGQGLQALGLGGMSEGELQRRTDMVARLQDDWEKLSKVVTVARQSSSRGGGGSGGETSAGLTTGAAQPSEKDREALLGGAATKPARRVFGAPPQETETTRPLDNVGLFSMQQTQIQQQENNLSQLTTVLRRQRQLGEAISSEIALHIDLLDDLSHEVDRVGDKLHTANRQLNKLS